MDEPVNSNVSVSETQFAAPVQAAPPATVKGGELQDLKMVGRFSRYTSVFWQIVLPFLGVRAFFEEANRLFKFNDRVRKDGLILGKFKDEGLQRWATLNIMTLGFGAALSNIAAYYTYNTYRDIKKLYAEAVGYELGKPAKDIGFRDLKRSQNIIVKTTMHALINRTLKRFGAAATIFIPWGPILSRKQYHDRSSNNHDNFGIKLGAGIMAGYLFTDGFLRKQSLFEAMQERLGDPNTIITPADINLFLTLDKKSENASYLPPLPDSQQAQQNAHLEMLIATKMNHTYKTSPPDANLTAGKFVYMLGFDMLDAYPANLGLVELASRSQGVNEVRTASAAIKNGQSPESVFHQYGIDLNSLAGAQDSLSVHAQEHAEGKYANRVGQQAQNRVPAAARTPQDFVATQENSSPHLGM